MQAAALRWQELNSDWRRWGRAWLRHQEEKQKQYKTHLDALTPESFELLAEKILLVEVDGPKTLEGLADQILDKVRGGRVASRCLSYGFRVQG